MHAVISLFVLPCATHSCFALLGIFYHAYAWLQRDNLLQRLPRAEDMKRPRLRRARPFSCRASGSRAAFPISVMLVPCADAVLALTSIAYREKDVHRRSRNQHVHPERGVRHYEARVYPQQPPPADRPPGTVADVEAALRPNATARVVQPHADHGCVLT